jgi:glutaredoxin-related protein
MFTDIEARLASDYDGTNITSMMAYLDQGCKKLRDAYKDTEDAKERQQIKQLEAAHEAAANIIRTVWKSFHPSKRAPV